MIAAAGAASEGSPSAADRRAALASLGDAADDAGAPARTEDAAFPGPGGPLPVRIYRPLDQAAAAEPALIYLHGGGWVAGGLATHDGHCRRLCAASGATILAVDYRLAPEHPFPAAVDDALAATAWTFGQARALGLDPVRIGIGGDSVGAGLAAAVTQARRDLPIALQLLICPILDVAEASPSRRAFGQGYFLSEAAFAQDLADYAGPNVSRADPRLSPARAEHLEGLPPALVHTAEFDPFRDGGEAYAARLAAAGVVVETCRHAGMIHYFYALARAIPYSGVAAEAIGAQLRAAFGRA